MENAEKLIDGIFIPSHPHIMTDIKQASSNLYKIAQIINKDPGISARILKTINSPFYGLSNKIQSITHAVSLLGIESVTNIINSQLLLFSMKKVASSEQLNIFWNTSEDIAQCCSLVARLLKIGTKDEAYLLGLFHNCAIPILLNKFSNYPQIINESYQQREIAITDYELERLGTNHAVIAYLISRAWYLPLHVREAIREHHNLEYLTFASEEQDKKVNEMLCILKFAEHFCQLHLYIGQQEIDIEWNFIKPSLLHYLDLNDLEYQELKEQVSIILFNQQTS